jgi:hypothetical protein
MHQIHLKPKDIRRSDHQGVCEVIKKTFILITDQKLKQR